MSIDKLSLEGLDFQATKINIKNNILTITLNRPEKKNASPAPTLFATWHLPHVGRMMTGRQGARWIATLTRGSTNVASLPPAKQ